MNIRICISFWFSASISDGQVPKSGIQGQGESPYLNVVDISKLPSVGILAI